MKDFNETERNEKGRTKILSLKKSMKLVKKERGNLDIHKNSYYHQPKAPVERIQSTSSNAITKKRKKIILFSDSVFKNL